MNARDDGDLTPLMGKLLTRDDPLNTCLCSVVLLRAPDIDLGAPMRLADGRTATELAAGGEMHPAVGPYLAEAIAVEVGSGACVMGARVCKERCVGGKRWGGGGDDDAWIG